jgi:hypothetical protein
LAVGDHYFLFTAGDRGDLSEPANALSLALKITFVMVVANAIGVVLYWAAEAVHGTDLITLALRINPVINRAAQMQFES